MHLRVKTSFSKRLRGLIEAAKDGKGISQLPYWEGPSDDNTATAADSDTASGNAKDQLEETGAPDEITETLNEDPTLSTSTQAPLGVSKDDATDSRGESTVLEPSYNNDRSPVPKIEESIVPSDRPEPPTSDGTIEATLSGDTDIGAREHNPNPLPEEAQTTRRSSDRVTSAHFFQANQEDDGDLIDYEDGEDPPLRESTGSSTLAGDEAAGAANGTSVSSFDQCTQPNICYCAVCNNPLPTEDELSGERDHEITSLPIEPKGNILHNVHVETGDSTFPSNETVQAHDNINDHTDQIQEANHENGDEEEYGFGEEETFQPGIDDSTVDPSKKTLPSYQAQESEHHVPLETADDGDHGTATTELPYPYHAQDSKVHRDMQQQEDVIDDHDQITDALEIKEEDYEANRHDPSGSKGDNVARSEDPNPYALASVFAVDDDEISYEEDEIVDSPSQQAQEDDPNLETASPLKSASIKRSRGENTEQDVPDDGSQGTSLNGSNKQRIQALLSICRH